MNIEPPAETEGSPRQSRIESNVVHVASDLTVEDEALKFDSAYEKLAQTTDRIEETSVEVPSDQSITGKCIVDI